MGDSMTTRQPKGTPVGGQFAEGRKPEGVVLAPVSPLFNKATVDDHQRQVKILEAEIEDLYQDAFVNDTKPDSSDLLALKNDLIHQQNEIIRKQAKELADLQRDAGDFQLRGIIRANVRDRLSNVVDLGGDDARIREFYAQIDELMEHHFARFAPEENDALDGVAASETNFFMKRLDLDTMSLKKDA